MNVWEWLLMVASFLLTAFASGSETAFSSASRIRAFARAREGEPRASLTVRFMKNPERYLTATLVATNLGTVLCSNLSARMAKATGQPWVETVTAISVGLLILVFAEVVPKHAAFVFRDAIVDRLALPLSVMRAVLYPIVVVAGYLPRLLMGGRESSRFFESREEVRSYLNSEGDESARDADRVLDLGTASVERRMKALDSFPSISSDISRADAMRMAFSHKSKFILVFEPGGKTLSGMVRTSALLRHEGDWDLSRMTEGMPYFERSTVLGKALYDLRRAGAPAGVVMGPSGQPEGLIDSDIIVDAIIGEAVSRPLEPLGRL